MKIDSQEDSKIKGTLNCKHEWEALNKKASNRSWRKLYCAVSSRNRFEFFKDKRHFENVK